MTNQCYRDYMLSPEWKAVKLRYLRSHLPKDCFVCRAPYENSFHFHHRTYKNFGRERLLDIVPVCQRCHRLIHQLVRQTGKHIWQVTTKLRRKFNKWSRGKK